MTRKELIESSFNNLVTFKDIAKSLDISFWLEHGLLLGLHREGNMLNGDEGDVDVNLNLCDAEKLSEARTLLVEKGFHSRKTNVSKNGYIIATSLTRNNSTLDIHVHDIRDNIIYYPMYSIRDTTPQQYGVFVYPIEAVMPLGNIEWNNTPFQCPGNLEKYLVVRYGDDWAVDKIKNGTWDGLRNKKNNPCLQIWDINKLKDNLFSKSI